MTRFVLMFIFILQLEGCVSSSSTHFEIVSLDHSLSDVKVLEKGVIGEDCPSGLSGYGSYSVATQRAIGKVTNANSLVNVKFFRAERPIAKICVKVIGDAARL